MEDNGEVTIEAEDFNGRIDRGDGTGWRRVDQATASEDGMTIQPVTVSSVDPAGLPGDAPMLTYNFHAFSTGPVEILTQCLPTHRITSDHSGVRYAISLNGDTPQIVDVYAVEYSGAWYANTVRAASIGVSEHEISNPGLQTIQIWMVDAGVVLDKMTVSFDSGTSEAENLPVTATAAYHTFTEGSASAGGAISLDSTSVGKSITFDLPFLEAGTYDLTVRVKKGSSRGIAQMSIADNPGGPFTNIGSPVDLYASSFSYTDLPAERLTLSSAGSKYLRFTVTGKNPSSSNYWIVLDRFSFVAVPVTSILNIESWRLVYFGQSADSGDAADLADPDGDGISNLLEYSAGRYPTVFNGSVVSPGFTNDHFSITFTRMRDATDITYDVLAGNDLLAGGTSIWSSVSVPYPGGVAESVPVTVADPDLLGDHDSRFLWMKVTRP